MFTTPVLIGIFLIFWSVFLAIPLIILKSWKMVRRFSFQNESYKIKYDVPKWHLPLMILTMFAGFFFIISEWDLGMIRYLLSLASL